MEIYEGLNLLPEQHQAEWAAWEELFNSLGWELLCRSLQAEVDQVPRLLLEEAKTWEEVLALRVVDTQLKRILALPQSVEIAYKNAVESALIDIEEQREADIPDV